MIHARTVEIIEQVYLEIKNYGHEEQKKKLIAGIVLTGGGSQLKHLKQLVECVTGMDTRVGYPNEHLAGDTDKNVTSPLYATAVGLVMDGLKKINDQNETGKDNNGEEKLFEVDANLQEDDGKENINDNEFINWLKKQRYQIINRIKSLFGIYSKFIYIKLSFNN